MVGYRYLPFSSAVLDVVCIALGFGLLASHRRVSDHIYSYMHKAYISVTVALLESRRAADDDAFVKAGFRGIVGTERFIDGAEHLRENGGSLHT